MHLPGMPAVVGMPPAGMPRAAQQRAGIGHPAALSELHPARSAQESKRGNSHQRDEAERGDESKRARSDRCTRGLQLCTCHARAMQMPRTGYAHATHMSCTYHAHAAHMRGAAPATASRSSMVHDIGTLLCA
eukprot:scaffold104480_cov63-Phaeocystis_antarctica.AAC.1